jgi:hypothetical protein
MNLVLLSIAFEVLGKLEAPYVRIYDLARPRSPADLAGSSKAQTSGSTGNCDVNQQLLTAIRRIQPPH